MGAADEDEFETSSSSKSKPKSSSSVVSGGKSSSSVAPESSDMSSEVPESSSVAVDDVDEDCVGDADKPWDGSIAKEFACGNGTKLNPYVILTAEQLAHLSFVIDDKGTLVGDTTKFHKWTSIGNSSVAFAGNFDGNGHAVSGMFINTTSTHNGLFVNNSGTVQNLTVENGWVKGGKYTAGVVGLNEKGVLKTFG